MASNVRSGQPKDKPSAPSQKGTPATKGTGSVPPKESAASQTKGTERSSHAATRSSDRSNGQRMIDHLPEPRARLDLPQLGSRFSHSHEYRLLESRDANLGGGSRERSGDSHDDKGRYGLGGTQHMDLFFFATSRGFTVTAGKELGHNPGSLHGLGLATDVRTRGMTPLEVSAFMATAEAKGIAVRDERTRPSGQKVWSGPHLHLSVKPDQPIYEPIHFERVHAPLRHTSEHTTAIRPKLPGAPLTIIRLP
jgi:hypothetical protein